MERVIVERSFAEPLDMAELEALEAAASWCLEAWGITPLESYVSPDGRRAICTYDAPDAEAVRRANQTAGIPFDSVWSARVYNKK